MINASHGDGMVSYPSYTILGCALIRDVVVIRTKVIGHYLLCTFDEGSLRPISLYLDISSASDNDILLGVTLRWFIASHSGLSRAGP